MTDWWQNDPVAPASEAPPQAAGDAWWQNDPVAQQKAQAPSYAMGLARSFSEGVPVVGGLLNKASAATNATLAPVLNPLFSPDEQLKGDWRQRYRESLAEQEGMDKAFGEQHPVAKTAAEIAGGVASLGEVAATDIGAQALGLTAKTLPGMVVQGGVSGAALGAADAATRGGDVSQGAIYGGLAGTAGPIIGAGVASAAKPFIRAGRAAVSPETEAAQQITKAFTKDTGKGLTAEDIANTFKTDQPIALADVGGGRATQRLARRAANVSPEAQEALDSTIFGRYRDQNARTAEFIQGMSEFGGNAHDLDKALTESAKRVNAPAYQKAYTAGGHGLWDDNLEQMAQAPVVQDAIRRTMVSAKNDAAKMGLTPPKNPFYFDADGRLNLGLTQKGDKITPSLQFWDYVKRNLDKVGTRESQEWARILRDHLDTLVPEYGPARSGAAKFFGARDALQAGRDAVTPGTTASRADNRVLRDAMAKLTPDELKLFREGTVDQMAQTLLGKPDSQNVLNAINNSPKARERMLTILGPQKYGKLEAFLRVEGVMDRLRTAMGNSSTARQLGDMAEGSVVPSIKLSLASMAKDYLLRATEKLGRGIDERVAEKIGEMLASNDGAEYARAVQMIANNKPIMNAIRSAEQSGAIATRGAVQGLAAQ